MKLLLQKVYYIIPVSLLLILPSACGSKRGTDHQSPEIQKEPRVVASELENSLLNEIFEPWYPRIIDSAYGGYISDLEYDWSLSETSQEKALVQQARHLWATSFIYEHYAEKEEYLEYADHGFEFLRDHMWDREFGGFHYSCTREGEPAGEFNGEKRVYGEAFALYGLSQYYRVSEKPEALELARKTFLWMEGAHDPEYGGYFEHLNRDGTPVLKAGIGGPDDAVTTGLKDYNSSIHIMEALTAFYGIWPDTLVRERLEEMFSLIRDTFVHPSGYLQLFFYPDWTLVPDETLEPGAGEDHWYTRHITYGHDVETAYLLLETAHILGMDEDPVTRRIAKRLVDHSLESGWDTVAGGFFDAGKKMEGEISIINRHKSWWAQAEGLNALLLMHTLYPEDPADYYGLFLEMWEYIDRYLIDHTYGGWYNSGLDTYPGNRTQRKSHAWKTTYHNTRAMIHCIEMLKNKEL
ncbi:MAG: AGE family epimerase/isomerase [Bacteroidales bacterium]